MRVAAILHGVDGESFVEVIDAMSAPAGPEDTRSLSERRADALCELVAQALSPTGIAARTPCCNDHDPTDRDTDPKNSDTADHGDSDGPGEDDRSVDGDDTDAPADADPRSDDPEAAGDTGRQQPRFPEALRGPRARPGTQDTAATSDQCVTLPVRGRALLNLTMDYNELRNQTGHGLLDSGLAVTPQTVRRLACDADVVPVILGSRSEPLDIGRLAYTPAEGVRRALHQRDRGCTFPACTRRPRRCHAHHVDHWLDLGDTKIDNMCLLCRYHHSLVHHSDWTVGMSDGRPWFTPPAWLDPGRTPRPGGVDTALAG